MPADAIWSVVVGAGLILGLSIPLRSVVAVRGRIGTVSSVAAAAVLLAVLALSGLGTDMVSPSVMRGLSENIWLPAMTFGTAILIASVA